MICIYPGSFDPVTNGHLDLIRRCSRMYDRVIVAVLNNIAKKPRFTVEQRKEMIARACADLDNVETGSFSGLTVDFARQVGAGVIVRGVRTVADYEAESTLAQVNKHIAPDIETVFLLTDIKWAHVSSSMVKELCIFDGDISGLVPDCILDDVTSVCHGKAYGEGKA